MDDRVLPTLEELLSEHQRVKALTPDEALSVLMKYAPVMEALRIVAARSPEGGESENGDDEMLTLEEAAKRACVSRDTVLRSPRFEAARVKHGHRTVVVDPQKLRRILAGRRT